MTIKEKIKKTLEITALSGSLIFSPFIYAGLEKLHYNSLSNKEKIAYLENKVNTIFNKIPPAPARMGGYLLLAQSISKKAAQKEIDRLRSESK